MKYKILETWKPAAIGYGADVWLMEEITRENVIKLFKKLSKDKDPVVIRVHSTKESFKKMKKRKNDKKGYIAYCIRNFTYARFEYGTNEIRWMQEKGELSSLFGKVEKL